ncbi:hypothetical protein BST36_20815 [Mycolicibacterium moriokaense]|uniref:Uncharacterized protein n=1 Tax=Mycolicibacterium moriokaense TaxID=39691 RepID=A0AAD1HD77_9MYCO|nr:hypothetical protein [Mycolicibacterium moriokaense]MCV7039684.1 hypothetical protein [Mycolicibacterium moriokaense]ORB19869.1 hypothetical protein BST36_20815 [Mycolicibacterium moriokaense]BBX01868.1 hypothetical protein MMOR_28040 [Mycolicibacterium moriokaense]
MVGRPQIWHPFERVNLLLYRWAEDGRIADIWRNILPDSHRLFSVYSRADILALEWLGKPPRSDCQWCGTRKRVGVDQFGDDIFAGPIKGGGPRFAVVHLDGNNCARNNLKYAADAAAEKLHSLRHVEWAMRDPLQRTTIPTAYVESPCRERERSRRHVGDDDDWGPTDEFIPLLGINDRPETKAFAIVPPI